MAFKNFLYKLAFLMGVVAGAWYVRSPWFAFVLAASLVMLLIALLR